ncbi:MAG TPA: helix-turn-helix transcriptional regulator [Thermomicrobiales bacterium]|nr:helix-turn-helix transcriptional regulator [Thermomicrobiales bacterium]
MTTEHIGSTLESFLEEEGILEGVTTDATLRVLAWQIRQDLEQRQMSKAELARRMETSRSQVDRLMRADGADVKLSTLERAARVLDRKLKIELV